MKRVGQFPAREIKLPGHLGDLPRSRKRIIGFSYWAQLPPAAVAVQDIVDRSNHAIGNSVTDAVSQNGQRGRAITPRHERRRNPGLAVQWQACARTQEGQAQVLRYRSG